MRLEMLRLGRDGFVLINDAYNANPGSMLAAIEFLETVAAGAPQRVLVLGGMRELGAASADLHDRIARRALDARVDVVAGFGDFAEPLRRAAGSDSRVVTSTDIAELWGRLRQRLDRGATLLLKASRGERLERLVPFITEWVGGED
jgi:UDP-N-acetylmuramoyl-tripeptide--D-alanyl-D-alanine ligase